MADSYLINIDNDSSQEKDEILNYILTNIDINTINDIKCINVNDLGIICKKKIKELGKTFKQKEITIDKCQVCELPFNMREVLFSFSECGHTFHKKCMTKHFKTCKTNICPCCKDKHFEHVFNLI